jgi:hypothetical protein
MRRLGDFVYRIALLAFPPPFRRRHGRYVEDHFRAQRAALSGPALVTRLALWTRAIFDVLRHGLAAWRDLLRFTPPTQRIDHWRRDLHHAWRALSMRPAATLAAVGVFALGVGLLSAMFALTDPFILRPPPYANPQELVVIAAPDSRPPNQP